MLLKLLSLTLFLYILKMALAHKRLEIIQEDSGNLMTCALHILNNYFNDTRTLILIDNKEMNLSSMTRLLSWKPVLTLNSGELLEPNIFGDWSHERDNIDFLIFVKEARTFDTMLNKMKDLPFWNPRRKFLIVFVYFNVRQSDLMIINERALAFNVIHLLVVVSSHSRSTRSENDHNTKNNFDLMLYTYYPYTATHCNDVGKGVFLDTWSIDKFVKETNLFPNKLKNLYGCSLSLSAVQVPPVIFGAKTSNGQWDLKGANGKLVLMFAERMNFSLDMVAPVSFAEFGRKLENGSYDGIQAGVMSGKYEGFFLQTGISLHTYLDFDTIYSRDFVYAVFVVPYRGIYPQWMNVYFPFEPLSWTAVVASFLFLTISILIATKICLFDTKIVLAPPLYTLSILLGISVARHPNVSFLRTIFLIWVLCSLVLNTAYQGSLFGFYTKPKSYPPLKDINDLVESGIPLGGYAAQRSFFSDFTNPTNKAIFDKWIPLNSVYGGYERVIETQNFAFLTARILTEFIRSNTSLVDSDGNSLLDIVPESVSDLPGLFTVRRGSPFHKPFNLITEGCDCAGLLLKWKQDALHLTGMSGKTENGDNDDVETREGEHGLHALGKRELLGAFGLLGSGLICSFVIFSGEVITDFVKTII